MAESLGGAVGSIAMGLTDAWLMTLSGGILGVMGMGFEWLFNKIIPRDRSAHDATYAIWHIYNATNFNKADIRILNGMILSPGHHDRRVVNAVVFRNDRLDFVANGTLFGAKNDPTQGIKHGHFIVPLPRSDLEEAAEAEGRWITIDPSTASELQHVAFNHALEWLANFPSELEQDEMVQMLKIAAKDDKRDGKAKGL